MRKIGDTVVIRRDIKAGETFPVKDSSIHRIGFTSRMEFYIGYKATIVGYKTKGDLFLGYELDISPVHTFTDEMFEEANTDNIEAEELLNHMLKLVPSQLIDHSLDSRNEILFMDLTHDSVDKR